MSADSVSADSIYARVREDGLLAAGRPVVVMLSGGRDSTCLLDLAVRVAGAESVRALHVNYGIRESAGEDDRHCHELCAGFGVRLEVRGPTVTGSTDTTLDVIVIRQGRTEVELLTTAPRSRQASSTATDIRLARLLARRITV